MFVFLASVAFSIALLHAVGSLLFYNLPERYSNGVNTVVRYAFGEKIAVSHIVPHPYMLYANAPNLIADGYRQTNSMGYRNEEFPVEKPEGGEIRILALGGSTTYMWPYVKDPANAWPALLEDKLRRATGKNIRVINGGLLSAMSPELLAGYVFRHRFLKPDIVLIHTGGNDISPLFFDNYSPEYTHYRFHGNGWNPRKGERLLLRFGPMKVLYAVWLSELRTVYDYREAELLTMSRPEALERVRKTDSEGFRRNLDYLIKLIIGDGGRPVLLGYLLARKEILLEKNPPEWRGHEDAEILAVEKHYRVMKEIGEKYSIPFWTLDSKRFKREWYVDADHLNEEGEAAKAEMIFRLFMDGRIFEPGGKSG